MVFIILFALRTKHSTDFTLVLMGNGQQHD